MTGGDGDDDPDLARDQERAFALLTEVGRLIEAGRNPEAVDAAAQLQARFAGRPDDPALAGFGAMVLDGALWLLAGGCDGDALALCETVVERLAAGSDSQRAIAAAARLLAAQAAGRLGAADRAREQLEALCGMGEPALAGLSRIAGRLAASGADAAAHAQVAAATATVLWRLGRSAEAQTFAADAAASFGRLGSAELAGGLRALAREIAEAGCPRRTRADARRDGGGGQKPVRLTGASAVVNIASARCRAPAVCSTTVPAIRCPRRLTPPR